MIEGLPQWRCHKVVGAFKIGSITPNPAADGHYMLHADLGIAPQRTGEPARSVGLPIVYVTQEFFRARVSDNSRPVRFPQEYIGGYLVQYEDGYLSWSPAKAFEEGYTRIG